MNVPTIEMPAPLAAALQTLREREQDAAAAEAAVAAAREGVTARADDIRDVSSTEPEMLTKTLTTPEGVYSHENRNPL